MSNHFSLRESSIRKSTIYTTNQTTLANRSFISTHLAQQSLAIGDDMRKSRIQNLPNYRKINLGENRQFVIVFQTIEIERLSGEIEVLRMRLRQGEREMMNVQNYEVQIRELTEKCFRSQSEIGEYREEVEKLNKICETFYHENETLKGSLKQIDMSLKQKYESEKQKCIQLQEQVQKWRMRYQAAEKSKVKEMEDLRNLIETQRRSMIDRELREMTVRFQNQRAGLESNIRKGRELMETKNSELLKMSKQCQEYEISIMEMRQYQCHNSELQSKVTVLSQELVRLNEALRQREEMIQQFKKVEYELGLKIKQQAEWGYQTQQLKNLLQAKAKQADEWKLRSSRFQQQSTFSKQLSHVNEQLAIKLQASYKEIERMNMFLRQKLEEIETWKIRLQQKEAENSKLKNVESELPRYEARVSMLQAENQRIDKVMKSRAGEIQQWKLRVGELQMKVGKMAMLEKQNQLLQQKFNMEVKHTEEAKFVSQKVGKELSVYKKYQMKCRELEGTNNGLTREIDRLNNVVKMRSNELGDNRQRFAELQHRLDSIKLIQTKLSSYESKIILLTQEIERLNQLIREKNSDIDQLQQRNLQLHSKVNHYSNFEIKINENQQHVLKLQNTNEILKRDVDNWQNKYRSADAKVREMENQLFVVNNEKGKLTTMVRTKIDDWESLKAMYESMEGEMRQVNELRHVCQQQHGQIAACMNDIQTLEKRSKQSDKQLSAERNKNLELTRKTSTMTGQLSRVQRQLQKVRSQLNRVSQNKIQEYSRLEESIVELTGRESSLNSQLEQVVAKCTALQKQTYTIMQQFTQLLTQAQNSEQQTRTLYQRLTEYQDYARRISILDAELSKVEMENKQLEEDNKQMQLKYAGNIESEKQQEMLNLVRVLMAVEIEALRGRLQQREMSFEEMKKSILDPVRKL